MNYWGTIGFDTLPYGTQHPSVMFLDFGSSTTRGNNAPRRLGGGRLPGSSPRGAAASEAAGRDAKEADGAASDGGWVGYMPQKYRNDPKEPQIC